MKPGSSLSAILSGGPVYRCDCPHQIQILVFWTFWTEQADCLPQAPANLHQGVWAALLKPYVHCRVSGLRRAGGIKLHNVGPKQG